MSDRFSFTKPKWNIIQDKKVWETPIFSLHQIELLPDNNKKSVHFYRLDAPEWINVIALTPDNDILLVEQYRVGVNETTLEIPGGMVDDLWLKLYHFQQIENLLLHLNYIVYYKCLDQRTDSSERYPG